MKNNLLKYIIVFLLGGIITFVICYFFVKPYWEKIMIENMNLINIEKLSPPEGICGKGIFECPELQKINDRLRFMNNITAMGNLIETSTGGEKIAVINFPTFTDYTSDEKLQTIQKIKQSSIKVLAIGLAGRNDDFIPDIKEILKEVPFNDLRIRIYTEPDNFVELFDTITWKKDPKMKLSLELYNVDLPEYLKIEDYLYMIDRMIHKNNHNIPMESVSLLLYPLFDKFNLRGDLEKNLRKLSTQELYINGLHTMPYKNMSPDEFEGTEGSILHFLETSSIPDIFIENISMKKNKIVIFNGF